MAAVTNTAQVTDRSARARLKIGLRLLFILFIDVGAAMSRKTHYGRHNRKWAGYRLGGVICITLVCPHDT
jgi:hypothetical protein